MVGKCILCESIIIGNANFTNYKSSKTTKKFKVRGMILLEAGVAPLLLPEVDKTHLKCPTHHTGRQPPPLGQIKTCPLNRSPINLG